MEGSKWNGIHFSISSLDFSILGYVKFENTNLEVTHYELNQRLQKALMD